MFESCIEIRSHFSDFLDGACDRETYRSVRFHLSNCVSCTRLLEQHRGAQADLRALPSLQVPPQLALQLRVKASQYVHRNWLSRFGLFVDNVLRPLVLPASAGVLTALLFFGLIMGAEVIPPPLAPDEPPAVWTPPRVRALAPMEFPADGRDITLVTHIDSEGRAVEYMVLSGQKSPQLMHRLDRMMYFSHFKPATLYGKPTDGAVVLSLRRITVRG